MTRHTHTHTHTRGVHRPVVVGMVTTQRHPMPELTAGRCVTLCACRLHLQYHECEHHSLWRLRVSDTHTHTHTHTRHVCAPGMPDTVSAHLASGSHAARVCMCVCVSCRFSVDEMCQGSVSTCVYRTHACHLYVLMCAMPMSMCATF